MGSRALNGKAIIVNVDIRSHVKLPVWYAVTWPLILIDTRKAKL